MKLRSCFTWSGLSIFLAATVVVCLGHKVLSHAIRTSELGRVRGFLLAESARKFHANQVSNAEGEIPLEPGAQTGQFITLSADKTYLVNSVTKKPVFITGEQAFSLATNLSSDSDIEFYLAAREAMGFNLIWVGAVDQAYLVSPPGDALGDVPFADYPYWGGKAFTKMNERYFEHLDDVLQRAGKHGFTVLLNAAFVGSGPTWCSDSTGWCRELQTASDNDLTAFGVYLGNRYKSYPNIIWMLGGDCDLRDYPVFRKKMNDIAAGIKSADSNHLMTIETLPPDGSSQDGMNGAAWIDLDFLYQDASGMAAQANRAHSRSDSLPTFLGEDSLENEIVNDLLQRSEKYQAVLGGARLGAVFANCVIWPFGATYPYCHKQRGQNWKNRLNSPGSKAEEHLGRLMRSREHWKMIPDINHMVVTAGYGSGDSVAVTSRTGEGQTIITYIPNGDATTLTVAMDMVSSKTGETKCWWFNPSSGVATLIGSFPNSGNRRFTPPNSNDWVLVIDDADAKLGPPGTAELY